MWTRRSIGLIKRLHNESFLLHVKQGIGCRSNIREPRFVKQDLRDRRALSEASWQCRAGTHSLACTLSLGPNAKAGAMLHA